MKKTTCSLKTVLMMMVLVIGGMQARAQLNGADSLQMQFDSLDSKYFPSGILHNTSPFYWDCFVWDSVNLNFQFNNNYLPNPYLYSFGNIQMSHNTFYNIYFDLYLSSVRPWAIKHPNEYFEKDSLAQLNSNFPISILRMNFHELDQSAIGTNIWFDTLSESYTIMPDTIWPPDSMNLPDSIFYVVNNPDSLAYLAFKKYWVNGANTSNPYIYTNWTNKDKNSNNYWDYAYSVTFSLPRDLFITNDTSIINSVQIDYDDGNGFVMQPIDSTISIEYHSIIPLDANFQFPLNGIPIFFEKTITLRLPSNSGIGDSINLKFDVKIIINENPADTSFNTDLLPFVCAVSDSGFSPSSSKVSIRYADRNYRYLTNPIIISGGFESDTRDYGTLKFEGLMTGYFMDSKGNRTMQRLAEMPYLLDSLNAWGYDIVFIDQKNPRDYIQNAGLTVIQVIQWVNSELKKNGSYNKPIVLGASMGGLIVRYALRMMELQGCCHNTRIYATFDSPHNGANISISSQYFVKDLRDFSISILPKRKRDNLEKRSKTMLAPIISAYDDVLNSPAARQMLIYHREISANADFNAFYSFIDSIGQPQNCRRLSIVNGSELGIANTITNSNKLLLSISKDVPSPLIHIPLMGPWWNFVTIPSPRSLIHLNAFSEGKLTMYQHNDFIQANLYWGKAHRAKLFYTLSMYVTDIIGINFQPLFVPMQTVKYNLKSIASINYVCLNMQFFLLTNVQNTPYPINYTEAPGSISETFKEVADAANKHNISKFTLGLIDSLKIPIIKAGTPSHAFMPSGTALDMHEGNLMLNIKDAYLADQNITPFDCYWAPQRTNRTGEEANMLHVEIDSVNRRWILEQIKNDWELRAPNGEYKGVLAGYYNYGHPWLDIYNIEYANKPHQTILYSLDIESNGQLFVNKQDRIGLINGNLLPRLGSTFKLNTNSEACDSTLVRIKAGGKFTVGENNNGIFNKAEVRFMANSRLEIFTNGQLVINDSSRLVIEEGATLVIHKGANIQLNGLKAILEIRGKVIIDDDASLAPQGNGFIRFAAKMNSSTIDDFWQVGKGSKLVLANNAAGKIKKAEIVEDLFLPDSLSQIFTNAIIEIDSMVSIHSYGSLQAQNTLFRAIDSTKFYNALKIYGQPNTRFGSCEFNYGNYGLSAQMSYGGNTFALDSCLFTKNYIGLYTADEYIFIRHCFFNKNLDYGWKAQNMQSNCDVTDCEFDENGLAGAWFNGQTNVRLNINQSKFRNNYQHGLEISEASLSSTCSRYSFNGQSGIFARQNAIVEIDGNNANQITNNYTGILLDKALILSIKHGFNNFSGNQYFIVGELKADNYYQGLSSALPLDLMYNLLPAPSAMQMPINIYLYEPQNLNLITVPLVNWSQNLAANQTYCIHTNTATNYTNYQMFEGLVSVSVLNTGRFTNTYLTDAFRTAAMQMSYGERYLGNDTLAISLFNDIFNHIPATINDDERRAIDEALNLMISALTYAIEHRLIDPNRALDGMPVDEYVDKIKQEIQRRLDDVEYTNMYAKELEAYYQLLMAQMYRAAEHYDYALSILQNENYFFNTTLKNQSDYWNCVCTAENLLLKGQIKRDEYNVKIDSCHGLSNARRAGFSPIFGSSSVRLSENANQIVAIYPNPAEQLIAVEFSQMIDEASAVLSDVSGKVIWTSQQIVKGKQLRLKLPKLSSGAYMLKTTTANQVFNNTIIIK